MVPGTGGLRWLGKPPGQEKARTNRSSPSRSTRQFRVELAQRPLEIEIGQIGGCTVARSGNEEDVRIALADQPVEVGVDEIDARAGPPVAEQPVLDVGRAVGARRGGRCP